MPIPLKRGHPCFFHCGDLIRGDGGSPHNGGPSSPSGSAGTVSALPGEPGVSPNGGICPNNRPGLSSTAGIRRNSRRRSGNEPRPEAKRPPTLQTVRSRDRNKWFVGLPIVPELFFKARSCSFGPFLFLSFQLFGESIKKGPSFYRRAEDGSKTMSRLIGSSL
jgi:hypothetical protein